MKRIVLFSTPTEKNLKPLLSAIFPQEMKDKVMAYMPSDGANCLPKYRKIWEKYAGDNNSQFIYIDNSKIGEEAQKELRNLKNANILVISGGNTFTLMRNLRRSGLDKAIIQFTQKPQFILEIVWGIYLETFLLITYI